jgi:hypothetical protein
MGGTDNTVNAITIMQAAIVRAVIMVLLLLLLLLLLKGSPISQSSLQMTSLMKNTRRM